MAERGEFRAIARALIDGPDFQKLPTRASHVFLLLKLNFGAAGIEVWYPDELLARLCRQSGMAREQVMLALDVLEHEGWVKRADNVFWIVGQLEFDPHMNVKNSKHRAFVVHTIAGLPHIDMVREFVAQHPAWFEGMDRLSNGIGWVFDRLSKPRRRAKIGNRIPTEAHPEAEAHPQAVKQVQPSTDSSAADATDPDEPIVLPAVHWVQEGAEWWRSNIGDITEPRFGAALKAAVDRHGWAVVFSAMKYYHAKLPAGKSRKPIWFAEEAARWIAEEADGHTLIGVGGNEAEILAYCAANPIRAHR